MSDTPSTLTKEFSDSTDRFSDRTAFEFKRHGVWERVAYSELRRYVNSVRHFLIEEGTERGERIALMLNTSPEWPIFYFGIMFSGATCVPLDPATPGFELSNILNNAGCRILFTSSEGLERLDKLETRALKLKKIICVEDIRDNLFKRESESAPEPPELDIKKDDIASILYTSGTTDLPKGVMLSHGNFMSNFYSIKNTGLYSENDGILSILPLYHSYAFMITLIVPLFSGSKIIYPESLASEDIFGCLKEKEVSLFVAVPQILYSIHSRIWNELCKLPFIIRVLLVCMMNFLWFIRKNTRINLSRVVFSRVHRAFGRHLRFFTSGGARLDPKKELDFFKLGFTVLEGYGLTETSPVATFNIQGALRIGSVGRAIDNVEIKIDKPDSSGVGEVLIKGPNVMKGYYKQPDKTRQVLKDSWFYTGDLGYLTKDGFLHLVGRSKEVIILSSGKNIYPEELELYYGGTPFVKELCLLGANQIKEDTAQDGLYAVVAPDIEHFKKEGETDLERVIKGKLENLSKDMPSYKRILKFVITKDKIPRTRLGKIKRYEVLNAYRDALLGKVELIEQEISPEDKLLISSDVGKRVLKCISVLCGIKRGIYPDESLELSLGVDSLMRIEMISALEKEFSTGIPPSFAAEVFYVKDVIKGMDMIIKEKTATPIEGARSSLKDEEFWRRALGEEPAAWIKEKIELRPGILSSAFTFMISGIFFLFFKIFYNLRVYGKEFIPRIDKPIILCANHTSYYDGFVIAFSAPFSIKMKLFFFAFKGYFQVPVVRDLMKMLRVIPIDTAEEVLSGMQSASYVLKNNKMLCIFPEGQRSFDGELKKFKKGIGILAKELNATFLPVIIKGAFRAWPRANPFPRLFCPVSIYFGKPLDYETLMSKAPQGSYQDDYEQVASGLREEMINLWNKFNPSGV